MGYPFFVVLLFVNLSNEVERIRFIMTETRKWKQSFLIVALGQAVSLLGSHGVQFALIWWLAEQTASPLMLGASGLAAYLPMTLLSPVAGIAADRFNRKFICIFSDLAMGFCALMYAVLLCWFDLPVWTVFFLLCTRGAGSAFQQPAIFHAASQTAKGQTHQGIVCIHASIALFMLITVLCRLSPALHRVPACALPV